MSDRAWPPGAVLGQNKIEQTTQRKSQSLYWKKESKTETKLINYWITKGKTLGKKQGGLSFDYQPLSNKANQQYSQQLRQVLI